MEILAGYFAILLPTPPQKVEDKLKEIKECEKKVENTLVKKQ